MFNINEENLKKINENENKIKELSTKINENNEQIEVLYFQNKRIDSEILSTDSHINNLEEAKKMQ